MQNQRALWAALTLVIAITASCGAGSEHKPDGGAQGGGTASSSAASTGGAGGAGGGCALGETACNGMCVNTSTDPANCGACGKACPMGQACQVGSCAGDCGPNLPPCDDANSCTLEMCNLVTMKCEFTPVGPGTSCNDNGGSVCDGGGTCVPCNVNVDCPGKTDDCQHPLCVNHICGHENMPADTPISPALQIPGDCHVVVCDGNGGTKVNVDDTDAKGDGNPCTKDICNSGVLQHPPEPPSTPCGVNHVCDGMGFCTDCVSDAECTPPTTCGGCGMPGVCCCKPKTCVDLGAFCGLHPDGCGGMIQCNDNQTDGGETDVDCGGPSCSVKCAQGKKCSAGTDCSSGFCADGVCCDTACNGVCQSCTAAKKGAGADGTCGNTQINTDPDDDCVDQGVGMCGTNGLCDGAGACQFYAPGSICVPPSCANANTVNNKDTCNAAHMCVDGGTTSCGYYACANGACKASCATDADCAPTAFCGFAVCLPKRTAGNACGAPNQCLSGKCVDGVCCTTDCNGTCLRCNLLPNVGLCSAVSYGNDDPPTCQGPSTVCDGMGKCLKVNGTPCGVGTECLSGVCFDGVCCNLTCFGTCRACNVPGLVGTCSNVPMGSQDPGTCVAPNACNGASACKKQNGQLCGAASECASGNCVDGYCCNITCTGLCMACNLPGQLGTCSGVLSGPDDTCMPPLSCNGGICN